MQISLVEINRYRDALTKIKESAETYTKQRVLAECKDLDVAKARETAIEIISMAVSLFGMQSQAMAVELFNEIMEASDADCIGQVVPGLTDHNNIVEKVHYYARKLIDGDLQGFAEDCSRRAGFYVWREAQECQVQNVVRNNN